jgi:hypothetical protein
MSNLSVSGRTDAAGLRASRAWLLGKGLAAEVVVMRLQGGDEPVPVPGLRKLLDRLNQNLRDVSALSDRIDDLLHSSEPAWNLMSIVEVEADALEEGAEGITRVARQIAQLALGVSTGLEPSKGADRLDSAAIAVLSPPCRLGETVGLVCDGIELFSHVQPELEVEFRGICCRMLLDHNVVVRIGDVELIVGSDEVLHLSTPDGDLDWEAPVEVSYPARATVKALKSLGMSVKEIREAAVAKPL